MEENKICKCCSSESRGGGGVGVVCLMLDGNGSRQSNQSLCILANTLRTIHEKDKLFENPVIPCRSDSDKVDWKLGRPMLVVTECATMAALPPSLNATLQVPNKMSALRCTIDRATSQFQLAVLIPLGHTEGLWNLCCVGVREPTFNRFPHRGETLSVPVFPPRFRLSSVWVS